MSKSTPKSNSDRFNKLLKAITVQNVKEVETLLSKLTDEKTRIEILAHYDSERADEEPGATLLGYTITMGIVSLENARKIAAILIDNGADVNQKSSNIPPALHLAAQYSDADTLRFLMERGADVSLRDHGGNVAMHHAIANGNLEAAIFLMKFTDLNAQNEDGKTLADSFKRYVQISHKTPDMSSADVAEKVEESRRVFKEVTQKTEGVLTPQFASFVESELKKHDKPADVNDNLLLEEKPLPPYAMVDFKSGKGRAQEEILKMMVKAGLDVSHIPELVNHPIETVDGVVRGPLYYAIERHQKSRSDEVWENPEIAQLVRNGAEISSFLKPGDFDKFTSEEGTLLHFAAAHNRVAEIVKLSKLLGEDLKTTISQKDIRELTPFLRACESENSLAAQTLIRLGSDVNAQNNGGQTAIFYAAGANNPNAGFFDALIKAGADLNHQSKSGHTALDYAIQNYSRTSKKLFLIDGAKEKMLNELKSIIEKLVEKWVAPAQSSHSEEGEAKKKPDSPHERATKLKLPEEIIKILEKTKTPSTSVETDQSKSLKPAAVNSLGGPN